NRAMPLIRYDIGDVGRIVPGTCPCGRSTLRFRVAGRIQDTLVTNAGRVLTDYDLSDFFYAQPGLGWFQLVQRFDTRFDLNVLPDEQAALAPEVLSKAWSDYFGGEARTNVFRATTITPENGGKFRFVKSSSYERFDDNSPAKETGSLERNSQWEQP